MLYPTDTEKWPGRPQATQTDDNGHSIAVRVGGPGAGQEVEEILITYSGEGQINEVGSYAHDGRVAAIRRAPDGSIARIFLYAGTRIQDRRTGHVSNWLTVPLLIVARPVALLTERFALPCAVFAGVYVATLLEPRAGDDRRPARADGEGPAVAAGGTRPAGTSTTLSLRAM